MHNKRCSGCDRSISGEETAFEIERTHYYCTYCCVQVGQLTLV